MKDTIASTIVEQHTSKVETKQAYLDRLPGQS
jgi:hypothetical protein